MVSLMQQLVNGLVLGMTYIFIALGLSIIFSMLRILTFAHGEIYMLGGYVTWIFVQQVNLPYYVGLLLAVLVMFLVGMAFETVLWRPLLKNPMRCLIMSLALSGILVGLANLIFGPIDKTITSPVTGVVTIAGVSLAIDRIALVVASTIMLAIVMLFFKRHNVGIAMRAISLDPDAAALQGIPVQRIQRIGFGMGCALAGFSGGLVGGIFSVNATMGQAPIVKAFIVVVLGGLGSIPGTVLAGLMIGMLDSFAVSYFGSIGNIFAFLVFVVVLLVRPRGLMGYAEV